MAKVRLGPKSAMPKLARYLLRQGVIENRGILTYAYDDVAVGAGFRSPKSHAPFTLLEATAVAVAWITSRNAWSAHAAEGHRWLSAGGKGKTKHQRPRALQLAFRAWKPLLTSSKTPTRAQIINRATEIASDASLCRWSALAPVKLLAMSEGWSAAEVNQLVMPIGQPVRAAIEFIFGIAIAETTSGHALANALQLRLAKWGGGSLIDINSGLHRYGGRL